MTRLAPSTVAVAVAVVVAVAAVLANAPQAGAKAKGKLTGTVGPSYTITMSAKSAKAGTYAIAISDRSNIHNFHLVGPGVDKKSSIGGTGTTTWRLTLKRGTYRFSCDAHSSIMHGSLKVT